MAEAIAYLNPSDEGGVARALPANVEAEAAFLGACLIDNRVTEDLPVRLTPDHFFEPVHARLFAQVMALIDKNQLASPVTLRPFFEADEALASLGGSAYLAQLTSNAVGLIGARDFARQIYELAMLRALVAVGRDMVDAALDTSETIDPMAQIEAAEGALYRVSGGDSDLGSVKSFGMAAKAAVAQAERALNNKGHLSGITTGLDKLNAKIGGMHNSDLMILAGRPGMGKTSLATNIAFAAARRYRQDADAGVDPAKNLGAKVAFFSLEMSADQLATRILAEQSQVSSQNLRMGKIDKADFAELVKVSGELQTLPLFIDDTAGLTIAALRTRARRLQRRHGIGLIIVDYLQLLQGSGNSRDNRVQEISEISRGLKTLAKELNVPVLALSQLSRAVEQREDKRPQLSDLRESGSIEQDADMVFFVYREDYYLKATEPQQPVNGDDPKIYDKHGAWLKQYERAEGLAELIVAKQRHGATGKVRMRFDEATTRFTDLADDSYQNDFD